MRNHFIIMLFFLGPLNMNAQSATRMDVSFLRAGNSVVNPYVGGLLSPQFHPIDLNLDGTQDLLVFDRIGDVIMPFLRMPDDPESLLFAPEFVDIFPETKAWIVLKDYDGDGIEDIFKCPSVPGIPGIEVWKGVDNEGSLGFELVENQDRPFDILYIPISNGYTQIYVSIIDIPAIEDVDGDGDLDVLSFEPGGSKVTFYKNVSVENGFGLGQLVFRLQDNCYGKFQESGFSQEVSLSGAPNVCASFITDDPQPETRHSGSTILVFDENGDGLVELLLGDLAYNGMVLLENGGTSQSAWIVDQDPNFPSYDVPVEIEIYNAAFFLDMNLDGNRDLIVAPNELNSLQNNDHIWYYENVNTDNQPEFRLRNRNFLVENMLHFGTNSNPCFADYNQDGLMDLIVGTQGFRNASGLFMAGLYLFENQGTATSPEFNLINDDYLSFSQFTNVSTNFSPTSGDLDGDGDIDLIVGDGQGDLYYLENIAGTGRTFNFADPVYPYFNINVGQQVKPCIFDFNEDGLGDLVIGERNFNSEGDLVGSLNYLQNVGTQGNPIFRDIEMAPNDKLFGGVDLRAQGYINNYSAPAIVNVGEDFLLFTGSESGVIHVYNQVRNNLTGTFQEWIADLGIREGIRTTPAAADIDGDGYIELAVGNLRGGLALYDTDLQIGEIVPTIDLDELAEQVRIYPNPGDEFFNIRTEGNVQLTRLEVWDILGNRLQVYTGHEISGRINTRSWESGIYFIVLHTGDRTAVIKWLKV